MNMMASLATLFGIGRLKPAPGTWGSAAGLLLGWGINDLFGSVGMLLAILLGFFVGIAAANAYEQHYGRHDSPEVVIDEMVGQWVALLPLAFAGGNAWLWAGAFAAFRLFDIWKPWPISRIDRYTRGGFGVMADDMVAGLFAAVIIGLILLRSG